MRNRKAIKFTIPKNMANRIRERIRSLQKSQQQYWLSLIRRDLGCD